MTFALPFVQLDAKTSRSAGVGQAFPELRRLQPVSRNSGFERGTPIDRHYIRKYLLAHAADIRGHVLEVKEIWYARLGEDRVRHIDVLDVAPENQKATLVVDLTHTSECPENVFDCFILTQTLHFIYDLRAAVRSVYRMLKPGGVVLVTGHGISQLWRDEPADYWRFTSTSLRRLFEERFPPENVEVSAYGNVLSSTASLHGLAAEELAADELDHRDPDYELVIGLRAVKPANAAATADGQSPGG